MLCERCHEREATGHSTNVIDGAASSIALCVECTASSAGPAAEDLFAAMNTARCSYCGGAACSGSMDSPELDPHGKQQMTFLCLRCVNEFSRHWQQQMERVPHDLPQEEQKAAMRGLLVEADRHMRKWVDKRAS